MDRARRLARSVELARLPSQLRNARAQPRTPTAYSADSHSLPLGARGPCRGCAGTSLRLGSTFRRRGTGRDAAARAKRREAAAQLLPPPRHHNTAGVVLPAPHGRCHAMTLRSTPRRAASGGPTGQLAGRERAEPNGPDHGTSRSEGNANQPESNPGTEAYNLPLQSLPLGLPASCSAPTSDTIDHLNHPVRGNGQTTSRVSFREDLASSAPVRVTSTPKYYRVLELRRRAAVRRHGSPAVSSHLSQSMLAMDTIG